MTYTFIKAQGYNIGDSIVENDKLDVARELMEKAKEKNIGLVISTDVVVADKFSNDANTKVIPTKEMPNGWEGVDMGPDSRERVRDIILGAKTILWNGPVGVFG